MGLVALDPFFQEVDDRGKAAFSGFVVEFFRACIDNVREVAGGFDDGHLHAEADAEIGHFVFARELRGEDFALGATLAEPAGDEDGVELLEMCRGVGSVAFEELSVDPFGFHRDAVRDARMGERFSDGLIGVFELGVLSNDGDFDLAVRCSDAFGYAGPIVQLWFRCGLDAERVEDRLVQPFAVIGDGGFVDRFEVVCGDDGVWANIAKEGQLFALLLGDFML